MAGKKASKKSSEKSQAQGVETDLIRRVTWDVSNDKTLKDRVAALPKFQTGDSVDVHVLVKEGEKERVQLFSGVVIKVQGRGISRTFTVRKVSAGVGVERTFPISSPALSTVKVNAHGKVRRSRLYYLRELSGRSARLNKKRTAADTAKMEVKAADAKAGAESSNA